MSNPTVLPFPVYWKGKKIAEAYENDYGINPGRTAMFGAEGYFAHSKGAIQSSLSISMVVPWGGTSITAVEDCLAQNDVDIGLPIPGSGGLGYHTVTMAITENKLKASTEKGTLEGSLTLAGGPPTINSFT